MGSQQRSNITIGTQAADQGSCSQFGNGSTRRGYGNPGGAGDCAGSYCGSDLKGIPTKLRDPDKLIFIVEYFDREAELIKKYLLTYFMIDGTVEIADLIKNCRFLHRMKLVTVQLRDLFIGNVVNIHSRPMTLTEYGDTCTRQYLEPKTERAFFLIKPEAVQHLGFILQRLESCFRVIRAKMCTMSFEMVCRFYEDQQGGDDFSRLVNHMCSGPVVAFLLVGENAIEKCMSLLGDEDPAQAKLRTPLALRALYGQDLIHNAFHCSESAACVVRDASFFFPTARKDLTCVAPNTAELNNCTTCCVIKPHAVKEGIAGKIIADIQASNFRIAAFEMYYLDRTHAEEFYEIYKTVVAEYSAMTSELSLGPCYALEIAGCGEETQKSFRMTCGPADPEIARKLRPQTLRARYGIDKVHNAVHATDLPDDAQMEVEYFFRVLNFKS